MRIKLNIGGKEIDGGETDRVDISMPGSERPDVSPLSGLLSKDEFEQALRDLVNGGVFGTHPHLSNLLADRALAIEVIEALRSERDALLAMSDEEREILVKKSQGSRVQYHMWSSEHGRDPGYYFYLKGSGQQSNHSSYATEEEAWQCWGNSDPFELLDELAAGVNGWRFQEFGSTIFEQELADAFGMSPAEAREGHELILAIASDRAQRFFLSDTTASAAFPRLISVAFIWAKQQATMPPEQFTNKGEQIR